MRTPNSRISPKSSPLEALMEALQELDGLEWGIVIVIAVICFVGSFRLPIVVAALARRAPEPPTKARTPPQSVSRELEVPPPQSTAARSERSVAAVDGAEPLVEARSWTGCMPCFAGCCGGPPPRPKTRTPVARAPVLAAEDFADVRQCLTEYRGHSVPDQIEALEQFMVAVKEDRDLAAPDELTAVRFVRARRLDVSKVLAMYRKHAAYKAGDCKDALEERLDAADAAKLMKIYPAQVVGRCKLGRPVKVMKVGVLDLKRCGFSANDMLREHIRASERYASTLSWRDFSKPPPDSCATTASPLEGGIVIIDISGCTISKFWAAVSYWIRVARIDQDNYPEMLSLQVIINPAFGFDTGWNVIKPILDPHTVSKVEIIRGDARPRLAELVDQSVLPEEYRL